MSLGKSLVMVMFVLVFGLTIQIFWLSMYLIRTKDLYGIKYLNL